MVSHNDELIQEFVENYKHRKESYKKIAEDVEARCRTLLDGKVDCLFMNRRKDSESLKRKLLYRNLEYTNSNGERGYLSMEDITRDTNDLAGVRILLHLPHVDQYQLVNDLLHQIFEVLLSTTPDQKNGELSTVGRYVRRHYVVQHRFEEQLHKAEIQVQSLLTYPWYILDHRLVYKADREPRVEETDLLGQLHRTLQTAEEIVLRLCDLRFGPREVVKSRL